MTQYLAYAVKSALIDTPKSVTPFRAVRALKALVASDPGVVLVAWNDFVATHVSKLLTVWPEDLWDVVTKGDAGTLPKGAYWFTFGASMGHEWDVRAFEELEDALIAMISPALVGPFLDYVKGHNGRYGLKVTD